ncbi:unnamed protein product, partial [Prorocentrum cordatum]
MALSRPVVPFVDGAAGEPVDWLKWDDSNLVWKCLICPQWDDNGADAKQAQGDPWCEHFKSREHLRKVRNWAPGTTVNPEHPGAVPPPPRALGWGACAAAPPPAPAWGARGVA